MTDIGRSDYSERVEARRERLERAAARAQGESAAAFGQAHGIMKHIPLGQPILVGHHSEKRARRDQDRIHAATRKGVERGRDAERLAQAAESVGSAGISSDDPEAVVKLRKKLASLEQQRDDRKRLNAAWRKAKKPAADDGEGWAKVAEHYGCPVDDLSGVRMSMARTPWQNAPFPSYSISNIGANIRNVRERIDTLLAQAAEPEREPIEGAGYTIEADREINRVRIEFGSRPPRETCKELRSFGFKWSRTEGAWLRLLNSNAWATAKMLHERGNLDA